MAAFLLNINLSTVHYFCQGPSKPLVFLLLQLVWQSLHRRVLLRPPKRNQSGSTSTTRRRQRRASIAFSGDLIANSACQSFYVTLDISSAVDYRPPRADKQNPQPSPPPTVLDNAGPSEPPETPAPGTPTPMDVDQAEEEASLSGPEDRIQILDLHSQNPIVSYRNQIYSCEWTSTLGTDILLTTPTPDFSHPILREQPDVSVLAASRIKLMGRPAQLDNRHSAKDDGQQSPPAPEPSTTLPNTTSTENHVPFKIPLGPMTSRARQKQANFLERFMALKAQKGEKDSVTIHTQKANQGSGWRSQRRASEAMEDGDEELITPKQSRRGRATIGRPLGSRRNRGPRTVKGGLFRDYRPQLWDAPGADIRAGHSSTPESWDQLDDGASDGRQTPAITTLNVPPSPADQPAQPNSARSQSPPTPASAPGLQAAHIPPLLQARNHESQFSSIQALGTPNPDLAASLEQTQTKVTDEGAMPASGAADHQPLQQEQERTGDTSAEQNTVMSSATTSDSKENGVIAASDVEMKDA